MSMFTITPAQWQQNLASHNSRQAEIDKMRARGGRDWRLRNQPIPTYIPPPDQSAATMRDVSPPVTYTPHQISQARAAGLEAFGGYGPSKDVLAVQPPPAPPPVASPATPVQPTIDDYSPIYPDEQKAWDSAVVGPDKARLVGGLKLQDGKYTGEVKDAPPDLTVSPARQIINKLIGEGATGVARSRLRMSGFFNPIQRFFTDDPQERARMDFQDKAVDWLDSNAGAAWVNANPQRFMELWNSGGSVVDLYTMVTGDKPYTGPASPVPAPSPTSVAGPPLPTTPLTTNNNVPKFHPYERSLLYAIVQAEAGNQSKKGKQAVAATIINRINSGDAYNEWKDKKGRLTLMSVLEAPGQFEPVSRAGSIRALHRKFGGKNTDSSTRQAVQELLKDFSGTNPVGNALFFQSPRYSPYGKIFPSLQPYFESGNPNPIAPIPANSPIKKIGGHVFTPRYNPIPGVPEEDYPFGSSPASGKTAGLTTPQSSQQVSQPEPVKPGDEVDYAGVSVPLPPVPPVNPDKVVNTRPDEVNYAGVEVPLSPRIIEQIQTDNIGRKREIDKPSTSAGVLTDGTKSPTHEAVTRKNPKPRILSNWSPAMFNEEMEKGKEALRAAHYAALVAMQNWDGGMYDEAVVASDNAATTLRNIAVQKRINEFENGADGSRLAAMEAQASGKPTVIRPRSDGNFDIEVNGQIVKEGLSRAEVVSMFRKAASQRFTAAVNSAEVARNVARAEARAKKDLELSKILTQGQWNIWLEEHKPNITKTDDGGVLFKDPTGIFKVTPRGPTENEKELNPDKETYFDVTPIRTRGGEFSSAAPISGLTLYKKVTGSR